MTDAELEVEAQRWVGDEAQIREDHEREYRAQHMTSLGNPNGAIIGTNGKVDPYAFAKIEILLRLLDEARAQSGWQPIETAPKTGLVDLYCDHGDGIQTRVPAAHWYEGEWWASTGPIRLPWVITHWMKYPDHPSQQ
jgi:hypothetical protein